MLLNFVENKQLIQNISIFIKFFLSQKAAPLFDADLPEKKYIHQNPGVIRGIFSIQTTLKLSRKVQKYYI